jgi:hypothetical protein
MIELAVDLPVSTRRTGTVLLDLVFIRSRSADFGIIMCLVRHDANIVPEIFGPYPSENAFQPMAVDLMDRFPQDFPYLDSLILYLTYIHYDNIVTGHNLVEQDYPIYIP